LGTKLEKHQRRKIQKGWDGGPRNKDIDGGRDLGAGSEKILWMIL